MRSIVLDTETTGLDPKRGHRLVEIGAVELNNHVPTGKVYHQYINPQRDMPVEAYRVHGLSMEHLEKFPPFEKIVQDFLLFISDDPLVIHNARFDMGFINHELGMLGLDPVPFDRAIDTVAMAKRAFPGSPANLDALCRRFNIDNTNRIKHGALLDAELLADVYLELLGGRQKVLAFGCEKGQGDMGAEARIQRQVFAPRPIKPIAQEERDAHGAFLEKIPNALWKA